MTHDQYQHDEHEESVSSDAGNQAERQREQFNRNQAWFQAHLDMINKVCRGKYICIAGQELFAGNTVEEAVAKAQAAHPDDAGRFTQYIQKAKTGRMFPI